MQGAECRLLFDASLLTQKDPHAGLIFVAKSWVILWVIAKALTLNPALKGSFVFEIGDNATLGQVGYTSSHPNACLILDYDFAASDGYADYRTLCNAQLVPWEERAAKVFWRCLLYTSRHRSRRRIRSWSASAASRVADRLMPSARAESSNSAGIETLTAFLAPMDRIRILNAHILCA